MKKVKWKAKIFKHVKYWSCITVLLWHNTFIKKKCGKGETAHLMRRNAPVLWKVLTISNKETLSYASAADILWRQCGKRDKWLKTSRYSSCHKDVIVFFNTDNFIYRHFSVFFFRFFIVTWRRFAVCGKGLGFILPFIQR